MRKLRLTQLLFLVTATVHLTTGLAFADAPAYVIPKRPKPVHPVKPHPGGSGDCRSPYQRLIRPLPQPEPDHPLTDLPCDQTWDRPSSHRPQPYPLDPHEPSAHLSDQPELYRPEAYPYPHPDSTRAAASYDSSRSTLWPEFAWIRSPSGTNLDGVVAILIALGLWWWLNSLLPPIRPEPKDKPKS
ncbi:MAG: hypothetical protein HC835_11535 [Oscillatoriales cyanobacterium RM2_1_1]|nr:hypothetical protein [Oscillatoriales cyanobacterium SM2_3_0]NJO46206.1 hypothetical protein [Oscillatoriales cyanobacterium RM2_1_1]